MSDVTTATEAPEALFLGRTQDRLDPEAVETGVWHPWPGPRRIGLEVKIRPAASFNPHFRRALQNRVRKITDSNGAVEDLIDIPYTERYRDAEFVADALVADIRGICRADGTEVPCTPEVARALLSDPGNADVLDWVANEAHEFGRYYAAQVEEDEKNS